MGWKSHLWPEWKIVSILGSGAFGKVYKIKRKDIGGTYVAALKVVSFPNDESSLKVLRKRKMTEEQITTHYLDIVNKLGNEFALMEKLKGNTNIVSYEDHKIVPHDDGLGWDVLIRMEYLMTLDQYFIQNGYDETTTIQLGIDICKALKLCESEGIIHKDIKPANIFVSSHGDFKLGDFSIAQVISDSNIEYTALGTYSYMAPEVYYNKKYDFTVDIYSLGLILYRLTNYGRPPFCSQSGGSLTKEMIEESNRRRLNGEIFPPPVQVSGKLTGVILKACAYDPEKRYQTADELSNALNSCLLDTSEVKNNFVGLGKRIGEIMQEDEGDTMELDSQEHLKYQSENQVNQYFKKAGDL